MAGGEASSEVSVLENDGVLHLTCRCRLLYLLCRLYDQVNAELSSWWPQAGSAHAPVLLAWASVLCLIGRSGSQQGGEWQPEYSRLALPAENKQ